mgnify:FL=1
MNPQTQTMNYHIRKAVTGDMKQVLNLITELAIFEKEPNAVEVTEADLIAKGFGSSPEFDCFVAEADQKVIGIALVYTRFSTWKGTVLHLEDLIVSESVRGHGVGSALLDQVIIYGDEKGVKRVCWEVIDWNTPAIDFYEHKGARVMRDWNVVQLDELGIKNYISKLN